MEMAKFRAWDNTINKMLYDGDTPNWDWGGKPIKNLRVTNIGLIFDVEKSNQNYIDVCIEDKKRTFYEAWDYTCISNLDLILMQSTGLKDKNGVEIFEGDIVKRSLPNVPLIVGKRKDKKSYGLSRDNIKFDFIWFNDDYKVIGNIHQHPELLQKDSTQ